MAIELGHKTLAEAHYLAVGLSVGIKVGAPLAASHGKGCKAVFQDLFEAEDFRMERFTEG